MKRRALLVFVLLILVLSQGYTQPPGAPTIPGTPTVPGIPAPPPPSVTTPQPGVPTQPPSVLIPGQNLPVSGNRVPSPNYSVPIPVVRPVEEKSLDQMLDELEALRAKKEELEKKEKELTKVIQQKSEKQTERLKKLGVLPATSAPTRVGRILIRGNDKSPDSEILDQLDLKPGQVIEASALDEAKDRLTKAGFRSVRVELMGNEADAPFKDVLVVVKEPK